MTIKTCKTAVRASTLLAAIALSGGAFAGISESFESATVGDPAATANASLSGNGTVAAATLPAATGVGYPISGTHAQALEIAGTVTYTESSTPETGASQVDFMFKVEPTDELEDPTGNDIRVALAVGTNAANTTTAPIKLWCKTTSSGAAQWVDLNSAVETGSWMRATLVLDYGNNKCSVSLNGDPALNGTDKWFYFANNGGTYVSSITMVGSTMVDDLLVTHTALNSYEIPGGEATVAASGQGCNVTYDYINKYGVTVAEATSTTPLNVESGMSVADKFEAGLDPKSATKFELQTMTTTKSTATVTFPGTKPVGSYTVKAKTADGTQVATGTITKASESGENINSAAIDIPSANQEQLLYFTVETN